PDRRKATGILPDAEWRTLPVRKRRRDLGLVAQDPVARHASRFVGLPRRAPMRIGAADESELEGVDAVLLLGDQPVLERGAREVRGVGAASFHPTLAGLEGNLEIAVLHRGADADRAFRDALHRVNVNQRVRVLA